MRLKGLPYLSFTRVCCASQERMPNVREWLRPIVLVSRWKRSFVCPVSSDRFVVSDLHASAERPSFDSN